MSKKKRIDKKPDVVVSQFGCYKIKTSFKVPHDLHATTVTMVQIFKAEITV